MLTSDYTNECHNLFLPTLENWYRIFSYLVFITNSEFDVFYKTFILDQFMIFFLYSFHYVLVVLMWNTRGLHNGLQNMLACNSNNGHIGWNFGKNYGIPPVKRISGKDTFHRLRISIPPCLGNSWKGLVED